MVLLQTRWLVTGQGWRGANKRPGAEHRASQNLNDRTQNRLRVEGAVGPAITTRASKEGSCIGQPDPAASKSVPTFRGLVAEPRPPAEVRPPGDRPADRDGVGLGVADKRANLGGFLVVSQFGEASLDLIDEQAWLQHQILRLRLALRYTKARQTETILKEIIADSESRLAELADRQVKKPKNSN